MHVMRILRVSLSFCCLLGCQTMDLSEEMPPCADRDWFEQGRSDGTKGVPNLNWQERAKSCQKFSKFNHQSYLNGWYAGIDIFCSPQNAYLFGRTGLTYYKVCPVAKEKDFAKAYQKGLQVFLFEKSNMQLNQEIRQLEVAPEDEVQLEKLESLLEERAQNQKQISGIEEQMNTAVR